MGKYVLKWCSVGKVKDIYSVIREQPESASAKLYPQLSPPGVYLFLDDSKRVIDVGEANPKARMKLRHRIRNEIYHTSYFANKLVKLGMDRNAQLELSVKVATVEQGIDFLGSSPEEVDNHLRIIERALICETDPWSNSHGGVNEWRKEDVEIVNLDDHDPLDQTITCLEGRKCPKKWSHQQV